MILMEYLKFYWPHALAPSNCLRIINWVAELASSMQKPVPLIPRGSLREQMEEELLHYICVTAFFSDNLGKLSPES